MANKKTLDQHIAVFGERGSGKTVLVSTFYGRAQEPKFSKDNLFRVTADNPGGGTRLHQAYLGMRDSMRLPQGTNMSNMTSHSFSLKYKNTDLAGGRARSPKAVRLVWHDYPGEWFTDGVGSQEEAKRRVATFQALLQSDVALLLVDGQKLLDNTGEEERYLKSLFINLRNTLLSLENDLLQDDQRLPQFPRIWMIALSKADLLPDLDVLQFRDLVVGKAGDEISDLHGVVSDLVEEPESLSIGEDFMLLSSAAFTPGQIDLEKNKGLDLILPVASVLPMQRQLRWLDTKEKSIAAAKFVVENAALVLQLMLSSKPGGGTAKLGSIALAMRKLFNSNNVAKMTETAGIGLEQAKSDAIGKKDYLRATLTDFAIRLDAAEDSGEFLRSNV